MSKSSVAKHEERDGVMENFSVLAPCQCSTLFSLSASAYTEEAPERVRVKLNFPVIGFLIKGLSPQKNILNKWREGEEAELS